MLIFLGFGAGVILLAIASVLFYIHIAGLGNFLVVGMDVFRGINFLGSKWDAISILISGAVILLINLTLALFLKKRDLFLANLISFSTVVISLLILMAVGVIVTNN